MKLLSLRLLALSGMSVASFAAFSADLSIPMALATDTGPGAAVGTVTVTESPYGVVFTPNLTGLPPGLHGFHLHEGSSCGPSTKDGKTVPAGAAGGHYDPAASKVHGTPWGDGHKGDLPPLYVDADGRATQPVLAPRLKLTEVQGHALMVHANGDNHSDHPSPLGGGGGRIACGVAP